MKAKDMIYVKDNRIIFSTTKNVYDVTEHAQELIRELSKLKER